MYTGKRTDPPSRAWLILALIALAVVLTALGVFAALILRQPSAQPPQPSPSLAPALSEIGRASCRERVFITV